MKLLPEIEQAINDQITLERYSSVMYLQMSYFFQSINLTGFAKLLADHAIEEAGHATKWADYITDCDSMPVFQSIQAPAQSKFSSCIELFQTVLAAEQDTTKNIVALYDLAIAKNDRPTQIFVQWFIEEQISEEAEAIDMIRKLQLIGGDKGALLEIDEKLQEE